MDLGGWYSQHDKYLRITKNGCPFRKSVICKILGHRFGITYKFSDIKRTLLDLGSFQKTKWKFSMAFAIKVGSGCRVPLNFFSFFPTLNGKWH